MKRFFLITLFCAAFTACDTDHQPNPATIADSSPDVEVTEITDDETPEDVDISYDAEPGARESANTTSSTYFQVKSDNGERFIREFEVEDYYFGTNAPGDKVDGLTPTTLNGSKYKLLTWKGTNYVKSRALKYGYHYIRFKSSQFDAYGEVVQITANDKLTLNYSVTNEEIGKWTNTRLLRFAWDATLTLSHYMGEAAPNESGQTFAQFYTANKANNLNNLAVWYFDAEPIAPGKSCAVRVNMNEFGGSKILTYSPIDPTLFIGKEYDLSSKKGMSLKFKRPKTKQATP